MVPTGYTRLEYIESAGTQYIDTGFKPNQDTRVVCEVACPVSNTTNWVFGARQASGSKMYGFAASASGYYLSQYNAIEEKFPESLNSTDYIVIDKNKNITTINGVHASNTAAAEAFVTPVNLTIFAGNTNGTKVYGKIKFKSFKLYDNGTLIRNYIPAKNASGVIGLYDDINAKFYTNAGTGAFVAGPEIAAPTLYALSESSVTIQWGAVSGAANYRVYRDKAYIATTAATTWTDNTVSPYSRYLYHIETNDYVSDTLAVETPGTTLPELITDRTQTDVDTAKQILGKLLAGEQLTYAERRAYDAGLRGCYNASDATRVELHTRWLQRLFNDNGYDVQISTRMWSKAEVMRYDDVVRYLANIQTLVDIFGKSANTPDVPDISRWIDHIAANDIEGVLLDLSELASGAIAMFRISGTFTAGNDYIMQIIRR